MKSRRPGLGVEIALALALITLTTILLNAGVFWLLLKKTEEQRRTDLALALTSVLADQLEVAAVGGADQAGFRRVLSAFGDTALQIDQLYLVDTSMKPISVVAGEPVTVLDAGMRAALYGREVYSEVDGVLWGRRWVVVTAPVAPRGKPVAALRTAIPLNTPFLPGGPAGFVLAYTIFSGLIIAVFGFNLLRRRLLEPFARIRDGTDRIAAGEFGHLVTVDAARELAELCGALNTMSASLGAYRQRTAEQLDSLAAANAELRQAQEALVRSEKLAGVGRLAAGLAHEVGNPLAVVLGYIELLEQELEDPDLERDLVRRSRRELERIHAIIRQLLGYARTGTGQAELVDVRAAMDEAVDTVRHQPAFREIRLETDCGPQTPPARIERDKLHQVLVNLLLNAADAVGGGGPGVVQLRATHVPGRAPIAVRLDCTDSGAGFSAVALDRGLEPFFTTKEPGQGTGLGLATVQQIIGGVGGDIELANREGGGACVTLWLPCPAPSQDGEGEEVDAQVSGEGATADDAGGDVGPTAT